MGELLFIQMHGLQIPGDYVAASKFVDYFFSALLSKYGIRLNVLGQRELLPSHVQAAIEKAEGMTRHNTRYVPSPPQILFLLPPGRSTLNVCAPYASRHEITLAVQSVVQQALEKENFDSS
jgi:ditrans,polycis-polyprenyl diphosphate synthase